MSKSSGPDRAAIAKRIAMKINKKMQKRVVAPLDEVPNVYYLRRPSGIMRLDLDTGGGLPSATAHCISGPDGAGKSLLLTRYMVQQQRFYGAKSWLQLAAVEHPIDHFRLRNVGLSVAVPVDRIEQEQENRRRLKRPALTKDEVNELRTQVGIVELIHGNDMETTLETILSTLEWCTHEGEYPNIIGVDSWSALSPKDTLDKGMDEHQKRAAHASLTTTFFQRYFPLVTQLSERPAETTLILTQQVRANNEKANAPPFMQKFLPDFKTQGAYALKHGKCFDILVTNGKRTKEGGEDEGAKQVKTKTMKWELQKAKAGSHEGTYGEVTIDFSKKDPFDTFRNLLTVGVSSGVLQESNGKITWKTRELKQPFEALLKSLMDDPALDYSLRQDILQTKGIDCRYFT